MLTFEIYKDKAGEWRWRLKARNGKIIADSGEGYKERYEMENILEEITTEIAEDNFRIIEES